MTMRKLTDNPGSSPTTTGHGGAAWPVGERRGERGSATLTTSPPGPTVPGPILAEIRTRILTRLGTSLLVTRKADLPEEQARREDYWRFLKTSLTDPEPVRRAMSSNCSQAEAAALFGAMTVLLNPSRDTPERVKARMNAFSQRLSGYPAAVVSGVLEHWSENHAWQPAWAELKPLLDQTKADMEALEK